ncbi:cytochrome b [Rickettsiella endosymbiont of Aleochara curtula]|uniref:cytochrome b n=1 Tax=Rickettsiella endosymbiont of Aleochara curtula TaxID=3077936 RepID=UPI00313EB1BB
MMLKNSATVYGFIAKSFHWLMALLIFGMFIVAYTMINIPASHFSDGLFNLHKATGLFILGLVILRLIWRFMNKTPKLPPSIPFWQRQLAQFNITALYLLMLAMPLTGFFMSTLGNHPISFYGIFSVSPLADNQLWSNFFAKAHEILAYLLIASFTLHVIGAFYHPVLQRMWVLSKNKVNGE